VLAAVVFRRDEAAMQRFLQTMVLWCLPYLGPDARYLTRPRGDREDGLHDDEGQEARTMTEAEWLACTRSGEMLTYVQDKASERKLRLFMVACIRRIWDQLRDERSRAAVDLAEGYADGLASKKRMRAAARAALSAGHKLAAQAARLAADPQPVMYWPFQSPSAEGSTVQSAVMRAREVSSIVARVRGGTPETRSHCSLLRDLFGNPFCPVIADPVWLTWNDSTVPKLARAIYDGRHFADLPVLADALEDAGCDDEAILSHCRCGGEHVRGCWVLDLILGKE
jgi:hypothetical protein